MILIIREAIKKILGSAKRYRIVIKWLVADSIVRLKKKSFFAVSTGIFGLVFQIAAIACSLYYIKLLENSVVLSIFNTEFNTRSSILLLLMFCICILLCLILSSSLIYYSKSGVIRLRLTYEEFCVKRGLLLLENSNLLSRTSLDIRNTLKFVSMDANYCGRALQNLLDIVRPVLTLVIAFCVLIYLDFLLTIVVLLISSIMFLFQYKVGLMAAKYSTFMEQYAPKSSAEKKEILQKLKRVPIENDVEPSWIEEQLKGQIFQKYYNAYEGRLTSVEKSTFISNLFFGLCLAGILFYLVATAIVQDTGWMGILAYLLALRYALVSQNQFNRIITALNQFYPQFNRYRKMLAIIEKNKDDEKTICEINTIYGSNVGNHSSVEENL